MEAKICPIMSNNFRYPGNDGAYISATNVDGFVECQREKCALWSIALFSDGSTLEGCSLHIGSILPAAMEIRK